MSIGGVFLLGPLQCACLGVDDTLYRICALPEGPLTTAADEAYGRARPLQSGPCSSLESETADWWGRSCLVGTFWGREGALWAGLQ